MCRNPRAPQWRQPRSRSSINARRAASGARRRRPSPTGRPPSHRTVRTSASQVSCCRWDLVRVGPRWMRDPREAVEVDVQEDLVAVPGPLAGGGVGVEAGEAGVGEAFEGVGPGDARQAAGAVVVEVLVVDVDARTFGEHPAPCRGQRLLEDRARFGAEVEVAGEAAVVVPPEAQVLDRFAITRRIVVVCRRRRRCRQRAGRVRGGAWGSWPRSGGPGPRSRPSPRWPPPSRGRGRRR